MESVEIAALMEYLVSGKYPEDYGKDTKRRLREKAASYTVVDRVLYHLGHQGKKQRVVGKDEKMKIIEELHANVVGGCHFGTNATIAKVSERFWWKSMAADIRQYCKICSSCQRANPNNKPQVSSLHPVPVRNLFHRWGVDLIGPLKETSSGQKYIIVATEYLTRWVEVGALPDKTASSVHRFLMTLVYRFGACQVLLHDQGREFCNSLVRELCDVLATDQAMTSPYHPQTNGLTERFNQTMTTQLMKMVNKDSNNWDDYLQPVAFAYRTNVQGSTKISPFELLYGQKARLPIDLSYSSTESTWEPSLEAVAARMKELSDVVPATRSVARNNIEKAQARQKQRYDLKHSSPVYQVDDRVTIINRRRETRMGDKLAPRYFGPYTIHEILGKGVYRLRNGEKILKRKYNASSLKQWHDGVPSSAPSDVVAADTVSTSAAPKATIPPSVLSSVTASATVSPPANAPVSKPSSAAVSVTKPPSAAASLTKPPSAATSLTKPPSAADPATVPSSGAAPVTLPSSAADIVTIPPTYSVPSSTAAHPSYPVDSWISALNLTLSDKDDIISGRWLNDRVVDAASTLIRQETGISNQTTLLSQTEFMPSEETQRTVQVLHDKDHWVTVAGMDTGIIYADSLKRTVSGHLKKQIKEIFRNRRDQKGHINIELVSCDLQKNGSDCGLYAIANAVEFALEHSPSGCEYRHEEMRNHLILMLESGHVTPFPQTTTSRLKSRFLKL